MVVTKNETTSAALSHRACATTSINKGGICSGVARETPRLVQFRSLFRSSCTPTPLLQSWNNLLQSNRCKSDDSRVDRRCRRHNVCKRGMHPSLPRVHLVQTEPLPRHLHQSRWPLLPRMTMVLRPRSFPPQPVPLACSDPSTKSSRRRLRSLEVPSRGPATCPP